MDNQAGLQAKQIKLTARQIYKREYNQRRRADPLFKEKEREYSKIYAQTPNGKKSRTKSKWKHIGMLFTEEDFERIYNLYLTQELCNACDVKLTRGERYTTQSRASMDHDHETGLFRHIICNACNANDKWKTYFC